MRRRRHARAGRRNGGGEQSGAESFDEAGLGRVTRRGEGERAGGKAEVVEDGADDARGGDVGQHAPVAAALVAGQDVDFEGAAKQLGPGKPVMPGGRGGRGRGGGLREARRRGGGRRLGDNEGSEASMGSQGAVEVNQVGSGRGNECCEQA